MATKTVRFPKKVKFDGNPLLDNHYQMLQEYMEEGDTLEEALEQVLLFEVKEQWMKYNLPTNVSEWECEWDLDNEVTLTYFER